MRIISLFQYLKTITKAFLDGRKLIASANGAILTDEQRAKLRGYAKTNADTWLTVWAEATYKYVGSVYKDMTKLKVGRCGYGLACYEDGGLIVDGVFFLTFFGFRALEFANPDLVLLERERHPQATETMRAADGWTLLYQDGLAELWGRSSRYNDPQSADWLPPSSRHISDDVQHGALPWPAFPQSS